ncbi:MULTISPECIES: metal ABC transporter ATP-binding protein [Prevotella]|uniref:metal ABC transporter ATP-binding protein n=1 Tax=Prevotella TaxID=838 RepID=UPI001E554047|nr:MULTISPECIES: ABC transporter ATP-binding protein [Prevotella]
MATIIQLQHITASYGDITAIRDINLEIDHNDFLAITGPNGCGKTTLVNVILRLKTPDEGRVTYFKDEEEVAKLNMGYLPQYSDIDKNFPISVSEVVLSGLKSKYTFGLHYTQSQKELAREAIETMELSQMADRAIGTLSGGQLQRVLLARAIVSKPEVIILDEPNTYVDRLFQDDMYRMLHQLNDNCAIIIVSHDIERMKKESKHIIQL